MGREDWQPIVGNYGTAKQFDGATCLHWTPENTTDTTRVSLDVRLVSGRLLRSLQWSLREGDDNYYCRCRRVDGGHWVLGWGFRGP